MQVWIFACHAKCLGLNAIDCQKTDFRLVLKWWEAENLHSRGTLKTWGKGNSPGAGCSWNKRSTKAEPRGTYFGNALLQGYTFPEALAAFFFIFFPLTPSRYHRKKRKRGEAFWKVKWSLSILESGIPIGVGVSVFLNALLFAEDRFHLIMWPPDTKILLVLYKVKNRLPQKKNP